MSERRLVLAVVVAVAALAAAGTYAVRHEPGKGVYETLTGFQGGRDQYRDRYGAW